MTSLGNGLRALLMATAAITGVTAAPPAAQAQDRARRFDIPAQSAANALNTWARQAGAQIVFPYDAVRNRRTPAVRGNLSPRQALSQLTTALGLDIASETNGIVTLRARGAFPGEGEAGGAAANSESAQILVTGTRVRGGVVAGSIETFDRTRISQSGVTSIPELLTQLPQQPFSLSEQGSFGGFQYARLRGLPSGGTLTLINGRRTGVAANSIGANDFDLSLIPIAAVDRIDVLANSASAVYGADAIGGVINIITKRRIDRPIIELRYGTIDGRAPDWRVTFAGGIESGDFRAVATLDYFTRDPLYGAATDNLSNQDFRRFGGADFRAVNANPAAVVSASTANLPGLGSRFALLRPGVTGNNPALADFVPVQSEEALRTESLGRFESVIFSREQYSGALFAEYDLGANHRLFVDALYSNLTSESQTNPTAATLTVPASNPFNPFGVAVSARYLFEGLGPVTSRFDSDYYTVTGGISGRDFGADWEISANISGSGFNSVASANRADTAQAACLLQPLAARAVGACKGITEVLNPFQDGPGGSPALIESLVRAPTITDGEAETVQLNGSFSAPVLDLPGGPLALVLGGSAIREEVLLASGTTVVNGDRWVTSGFAELDVPLISPRMAVPAFDRLRARLAARLDHYNDFGTTVNPQVDVMWSPIPSVEILGSYSTSFSAPSLFSLNRPRTTSSLSVVDLGRNNERVTIESIAGGNPNLRPEKGETYSIGLRWSPPRLSPLELSATYWWLELRDRASGLSSTQILGNPQLFAERIVRQAPTPADVAAGLPGVLLSLDSSIINFAKLTTSGVDWRVSYWFATPWGRISSSLSATWIDTYVVENFPGVPARDVAGIASPGETGAALPEWRIVGTAGWSHRGANLSTTVRYVSGFDDVRATGGVFVPTGRDVDAYVTADLQMNLDLDQLLGSDDGAGMEISVGARNLFDRLPPFAESGSSNGYERSMGDVVGRTVYVRVRKAF